MSRGALPWTGAALLAAAIHGALLLMPLPDRAATPAPQPRPVPLRLARMPAEVLPAEVLPAEVLPAEVLPAEVPATSPAAEVPATSPAQVPPASPAAPPPAEVPPAEVPATSPPAQVPPASPAAEVPATSPSATSPSDQIARGLSGLSGLDALAPVVPPPPPIPWNAQAYGDRIRQRIEAHERYPARARRQAQEGETVIAVTVRADGHLAAPPRLVRSSGVAALDREALRMAHAAAPFPPPAAPGPLVIEVPVRFSLTEP